MTIPHEGIEITNRFFLAVDTLKAQGRIRSLLHLTEMYGLNYGNTHTIKKHPERYRISPDILASICRDFGVSAEWLLLGIEPMFKRTKSRTINK